MICLRNQHNVEMPRARGAYLEQAPAEIWENPRVWVLELKADGTRESLQIGAEHSRLVGRNRKDFLKGVARAKEFMHHPHPLFDTLAMPEFDGTLLDAELTLHFKQGKDGELVYDKKTTERIQTGQFVGLQVWGCLFFKGKDIRTYTEYDRYKVAAHVVDQIKMNWKHGELIRLMERKPATREYLDELFESGEEGGIAKYLPGKLNPAARTCTTWWKLKGDAKRTVDAFVVGVTEGKIGGSGVNDVKPVPSGTAASLHMAMMKDGQEFDVGKCKMLPDEIRDDAWKNFGAYQHRVAEMICSGWSGSDLRWLKFVQWREDKSPEDCVFEEQVGEV